MSGRSVYGEAVPMVVGRVYPAHWDHTQQRLVLDEAGRVRDPFPSLSLMQQPARGFETASLIEPPREVARSLPEGAPLPRLRKFPGGPGHEAKWRCQVCIGDTRDSLMEHTQSFPSGWGNTEVRAWNAWCASWATYFPKKT